MWRALAVVSLVGALVIPTVAVAQSPSPSLGPTVLQDVGLSVAGGPLADPLEIAQGILDGTVTVSLAPCPSVLGPGESPAPSGLPVASPSASPISTATKSWASIKKAAKRVGYKALKRTPDAYAGRQVYFKGQVLQAQDDGEGQFALVAVTKGAYGLWTNNVAVSYTGKPRIIEDDIVEFVMTSTGNYGYESAGAGYLTIPAGEVVRLRLSK